MEDAQMRHGTRNGIGRRLRSALLVVTVALLAAPVGAEINVTGRASGASECTAVLQRGALRLRKTLALCRKKTIANTVACRSGKQASYLDWLLDKGCPLTSNGGHGPDLHSDRVFRPFNHEPGHVGNIIHPDPDDPSTTTFVSVSPAERTVSPGEDATFDVDVTRVGNPPHALFVFSDHSNGEYGMTHTWEDVLLGVSDPGTQITMHTSSFATVPGTYEFTVRGLVDLENKYTEPDTFRLIVEEPAEPQPVTNSGDVRTESSNLSIFQDADFLDLSGAANQVGALFDDENNNIVDVESGNNAVPYPRFPSLDGNGGWTLATGRAYEGTANLIVWAHLPGDRFVAAHLAANTTTGVVTPVLLVAGDLATDGTMLSTDDFAVQLTGTLPTATSPGAIHGVVDGVPFFIEPNLTGNEWADRVIFEFDVPILND
jgi:hypothetical protein